MFDLSWAELLFVAILAILVVGPKEMPKLLKMFANGMRQVKKFYTDVQASMHKLEQEVDLVSSDGKSTQSWQDYLPEGVQRLPDNFMPGQQSAEALQAHQASYQQEVEKAKARFDAAQSDSDKPHAPQH